MKRHLARRREPVYVMVGALPQPPHIRIPLRNQGIFITLLVTPPRCAHAAVARRAPLPRKTRWMIMRTPRSLTLVQRGMGRAFPWDGPAPSRHPPGGASRWSALRSCHPKGSHSALGVLPEGPHSYGLAPAPVAQVGILGVLQWTMLITGPNPHRRVALVRIMRTPRSLTLVQRGMGGARREKGCAVATGGSSASRALLHPLTVR